MTLLRKAPAKARPNEDEEFDDDETTRMAELYLDLDAVAGNSERNQILLQHLLSRGRDGFDKGLFQVATIALMVLGAYLLGSTMRARRNAPGDREDASGDDLWLPSRDDS